MSLQSCNNFRHSNIGLYCQPLCIPILGWRVIWSKIGWFLKQKKTHQNLNNRKMPKIAKFATFWKPEACCQTVLPYKLISIGQNWWKMPMFKNSNETFWVIFKQCAFASHLFWQFNFPRNVSIINGKCLITIHSGTELTYRATNYLRKIHVIYFSFGSSRSSLRREHFRSFMRHALLHLRTETLSRKFFGKWVFRPRRVCNLAGFHASLRKTTHNTLSWLYPPPSKIVLRQTFWSALHFRISASSRSWHIFPLAASGKQE